MSANNNGHDPGTNHNEHRDSEHPAFERGRSDAQRGLPPREGTTPYLEGYAAEDNLILRKPYSNAVETEK